MTGWIILLKATKRKRFQKQSVLLFSRNADDTVGISQEGMPRSYLERPYGASYCP